MPPIGETLREARLRQRIEIAEVEQATKIRAKYLRALESEEFERLPGSTFVRTFLRTYAEYLGLDSQALVEEYRVRHELPAEDELQPFQPQPSAPPLGGESRRRPAPQARGRGTVIVGAVIAILALLLVIGLVGGDDDEGGRKTAGAERRDQGGREQGGGEPKQERAETEPAEETVELEVAPAADTYVCVENGEGEQLENATIIEPQTFSGKTLRVLLGNTLAVELVANGEEVPIEESPNPVAREFTPEGDEEISTTALSC
jgi:cytoskeleton protein RodZ